MRQTLRHSNVILTFCALLVAASACWPLAAQAPVKRPLSYDVVDYWRSIQGVKLSNDGAWLAYSLTSQADDPELVVRQLKTGQEFRQPRGTGATFTPDAHFVIFTIPPPKAETASDPEGEGASAASAQAGGGAPGAPGGRGGPGAGGADARNSLGIMTLADGKVVTIERAATFRVPEESSTWLAYHRGNPAAGRGGRGAGGRGGAGGGRGTTSGPAAPAGQGAATAETPASGTANATPSGAATTAAPQEKRKDPGTDLIVRNLATGQETTVPEVTEYAWDKKGVWLAYAVSSADPTKDGAFVRQTSDLSARALHTGHGHYKSLAFDGAGSQLAFLSDQAEYDKPVAPYHLYYWKGGDAAAIELVSGLTRGLPTSLVVSDNFAPRFSEDGLRLYLGTAPPPQPPPAPTAKPPIQVDLWSYKDALIQPMQKVRANQDRARNYRAVVHLSDKRFVQLATADLPDVNPGVDTVRAVGLSDLPYQQELSWDATYHDVFLVDLKAGTRREVLEHFNGSATLSPGGNFVLYFDEPSGNWFTYRISDGTRTNLTDRLPVKFFNERHDTPDLPASLGSAGWTEGDKSVLLYDQFDIWDIRPDGTNARMVTSGEGRKQHLVFRYRPLDPEPAPAGGGRGGVSGSARPIPASKPMLLATTNEDTRASGYYRVSVTGTAVPEKIMMVDKQVGAPTKAKNADVVVFTEQRFDEFPDLWVADTNFSAPKKVSDANPQQAEYNWGKAERIEYINADGRRLSALLIKPENFDPSKKYPLMVYIYEELSEGLHGYRAPNVGTSINIARYVSNGYVILEPDIVYETGYPGPSAMKCVIPAVNTIVAQGYIDAKRIGIQGHSWGGYQITYMITQTDVFRAVEAGAAVSNMISAYGGIRWGTGMVREFQYEKTQSRIGAAPWDAPLQFIENSPIFWIARIHTPYLTIHNDADDAVPWYQGIEFNTAMRRLGKEAYMFSYNGQPHGLRDRNDMKHWTVHMDEFFDHYLLGKPRPAWMDTGVPFLEKGTRDVSPLFRRPVNPAATESKKR